MRATMNAPRALLAVSASLLVVACTEDKPQAPEAQPPAAEQGTQAKPAEAPKPKPASEEISITTSSPEALEHFKAGRHLVENARIDEGVAELRRAVELDRKFALALAYLGFFTPTEEGMAMLERANALASELPKVERLYVSHLLTWRQGDLAVLREERKKLEEWAPNDWRVQFELGVAAQEEQNWKVAEEKFKRAIDLNEQAGPAYDRLGQVLSAQGKLEEAIAALRQYAEALPQEPAPRDSLAEAQMRAGKLDQAEQTFRKAAELAPSYWPAMVGVAQTKFLRDDFAGGRAALSQAAEAATAAQDKLKVHAHLVWSHLAEGDAKAALAAIDEAEKLARKEKELGWLAHAPVLRAAVFTESGKHQDAVRQVPTALERAKTAKLKGDALSEVYRTAFLWKVLAELRMGKKGEAEKSLGFLNKAVGMAPGAVTLSTRSFATGLVSWSQGEKEIAIQQMLECADFDYLCRAELVRAKAEAGDSEEAGKLREALVKANYREPLYLYARAKLLQQAKAAP
jgi:tetratricopeptide (TPR) repeat protein